MTKSNEVKLSTHPSNEFPLDSGFIVILMGLFILCSLVDNKSSIISTGAKNTHPYWLIKNNSLQQKLNGFCDALDEFDSKILGSMVFVANGGFNFNCAVNAVDLRELTEEELSNKAAKYQRADGQFVFHGTFMPKEEITEIIRDKFAVLTIVVQHRVISSKDTIIEIRPYSERK